MIALLTAIFAAAKPLLDEVYYNSVMSYVNQYVDIVRQISQEESNLPNPDDAKLGDLRKQLLILEDALAKQSAAVQLKPTA